MHASNAAETLRRWTAEARYAAVPMAAATAAAARRGLRIKTSCDAHCDEEDAGPERARWLRHRGTDQRDTRCEPAGRCTTTARKALRTAKVRACACTNTWTREAYNLGALGVVINMKTAQTLTPGAASPATHTHASLAAHPATYRQTARGNGACSICRMIACVLSMRRSMSIL